MFNLHIGIPGIIPDLLHSIERSKVFAGIQSPKILSRKLWQDNFRGLINSPAREVNSELQNWTNSQVELFQIFECESFAASQHALLGGVEDCFQKNRTLPYSDLRVARVSEIFDLVPLTFHLTIQSQFEYFNASTLRLSKNKTPLDIRGIPSWSQLVKRIKAAAPERNIVVWDFEDHQKAILPFVISLLDIKDGSQIESLSIYLKRYIIRHGPTVIKDDILALSPDMVEEMDYQYNFDLLSIDQIEGVSLVRVSDIPIDFYL